ncbi:MAG: phosphotransferase [Chloroflexia bacterium]|nr:phosphotransferase [Chloroflexia bacterium]
MSLIRAYTNDVYLVETWEERYVLKVYGGGWRHDSEIRYEADLLDHLASRGILVARAVAARNGKALQHLEYDGERRQAVLFDYAAGTKPEPPFTPALYHREGQAVAALHRASDDFQTSHWRRSLDLATLIDRPLALVASIDIGDEIRNPILEFGQDIRSRLETHIAAGLDWGVCHGDLTFDNLHITDDGEFVWYDFDSGGMGWWAIDIQGWTVLDTEWQPRSEAFLDGYRGVRPLGANDIAAAPYLAAATEIWGLQIDLERRVLNEAPSAVRAYLADRVDRFAAWRHALHTDFG